MRRTRGMYDEDEEARNERGEVTVSEEDAETETTAKTPDDKEDGGRLGGL